MKDTDTAAVGSKMEEARLRINEIDREILKLFERRMECVRDIAEYKIEQGLSITDAKREEQIIEANSALASEETREYYTRLLRATIEISKDYQRSLTKRDS